MFKMLLALSLISTSVYGHDLQLRCVATSDGDEIMDTTVVLRDSERNKPIREVNEWQFILSSNQYGKTELQAYQMYEPSRSYATAELREKGSSIELAIWKRDYLMEVRCTRL